MPKYTDDQIADYARQLGSAGAPPADIEAFIVAARGDSGASEAVAAPEPAQVATPAPAAPAKPAIDPLMARYAAMAGGAVLPPLNKEVALGAVDMLAEGGGGAAGQTVGAMTGPLAPVAIPALGGVGAAAGNAIGQIRQMKMGERDSFSLGEVGGAAVAGAIPGGSLVKGGAKALAKEGIKTTAGNVAALGTETLVDSGRLPTMAETGLATGAGVLGTGAAKYLDGGSASFARAETKRMQHVIRDQTIAEAKAAGYKLSPSDINPTRVNALLESLAGKTATKQQATILNQEITNGLAAKTLGLPANAPITEGVLKQVRHEAGMPYREIQTMATTIPEAKAASIAVEKLKEATFDANEYRKYYFRSGDPDALKKARAAEAKIAELDSEIDANMAAIGRTDLVEKLAESRKRIAQTYAVEKALNVATGDVSAPIVGRALDNGAPLTDGLKTIGKTKLALPRVMGEGASTPPADVNQLKSILAMSAAATGNPGKALLPFMDRPIRAMILSKPYQSMFVNPSYGPAVADLRALTARGSVMAAGREDE